MDSLPNGSIKSGLPANFMTSVCMMDDRDMLDATPEILIIEDDSSVGDGTVCFEDHYNDEDTEKQDAAGLKKNDFEKSKSASKNLSADTNAESMDKEYKKLLNKYFKFPFLDKENKRVLTRHSS